MDPGISVSPVTEEFRNELKQVALGSCMGGTVHGTGIYLTDSTPKNPGQNMV